MNRTSILAVAATLLGLLAGCSSSDSPTGSDGGGGNRTIKASPSFSADIQEIFNRRGCTGSSCHGSAQSQGLDLRTGAAYINLVNAGSTETAALRVSPGDAQNSYLVIKVEGRQSVGGRMPLNLTPLDSIDMRNIRNWIEQGAADN